MKMDADDARFILENTDSKETSRQRAIVEEILEEGESEAYYQGYLTAMTMAVLTAHFSSRKRALSFFASLGKRASSLYLQEQPPALEHNG